MQLADQRRQDGPGAHGDPQLLELSLARRMHRQVEPARAAAILEHLARRQRGVAVHGLEVMREVSPAYLNRFVTYVDALLATAETLVPGPGPLPAATAEEVECVLRWLETAGISAEDRTRAGAGTRVDLQYYEEGKP